jgi:uncharacterized damage-inducible protein DinB
MLDTLLRLFTHDDWANREAAAALARAPRAPEKARKVMAHVIGTEWLWYARIHGGASHMAIWPELAPAECIAESSRLLATWRDLLASLGPDGLARLVDYKNTKGEPWTSTVGDILLHVLLHSSYHRGQVATLLRDSGNEPVLTDYIFAVRQGKL